MTIDQSADLSSILGSDTELPRTAVTYSDGTNSESVTGVLVNDGYEALDDGSLAVATALFMVQTSEFSTITAWSVGDTVAVSGTVTWRVVRVQVRSAHLTCDLQKQVQRGRSL